MDILFADSRTGETETILSETSETYVDMDYNDNFLFLPDGNGFISTSEKDGFKHIYQYDLKGNQTRQITKGEWEVTELVAVDSKAGKVYYVSTEQSPLERQFYSIDLKGKKKTLLSPQEGTHSINMSPDQQYYIDAYSTVSLPLQTILYDKNGKEIKVLENNRALQEKMQEYAYLPKEFFSFNTIDGTSLNGYMIKPTDFDQGKTYPVLMYVYGGPGSQNVMNNWGSTRDWWHQHLAAEGYIVVSIDNRGTGGRGRDFKHSTYNQLGKLETEDQIAGAKFLAELPYVDEDRIGI